MLFLQIYRSWNPPLAFALIFNCVLFVYLSFTAGQLVFEGFLRSEYSEENLLFWLACEAYKKKNSETEMTATAKRIYKEFVRVGAPRQVSQLPLQSRWTGFLSDVKPCHK